MIAEERKVRYFSDRMAAEQLKKSDPALWHHLKKNDLGKITSRSTLHFCGLTDFGGGAAAFFLPRQSNNSRAGRKQTAVITMQSLARYGREVSSRTGSRSVAGDGASLLALVYDLVEDFRQYGIYAERIRYATRNEGKPHWPNTLRKELPYISGNNHVFADVRSSRALDAQENPLSRIQAAVLREIFRLHGWWLGGLVERSDELHSYSKPAGSHMQWARSLKANRQLLYSERALSLTGALVRYLDATSSEVAGSFLYGVEDFHAVWEHMLRKVLPNVEEGWNAKLMKPVYVGRDGLASDLQERGMQTDIVIRTSDGLKVVDAKYYDATGKGSVPGWGDIVKQLYYVKAMEIAAPEETISSCFAFPCRGVSIGKYSHVEMVDPSAGAISGFAKIECLYLDTNSVMAAYISGGKLNQGLPL